MFNVNTYVRTYTVWMVQKKSLSQIFAFLSATLDENKNQTMCLVSRK